MLGWFKKKFAKKQDEPVEDIQEMDEPFEAAEEVTLQDIAEPANVDSTDTAPSGSPTAQDIAQEEIVETSRGVDTEILSNEDAEPPPARQEETTQPPEADAELEVEEKGNDHKTAQEQGVVSEISPEALSEEIPAIADSEQSSPRKEKKSSFFSRLSERLGKTKESFTYQIDALFLGKREISADLLEDLEEILIMADLGVSITEDILEFARRKVKRKELSSPDSLKQALKKKIKKFILENEQDASLVMPKKGPFVIMVIGVNGVGKTTTIGKIAHKFVAAGSSVMLVAADTFRAAAVSQLKIWGERNQVDVIAHKDGADPSSVVFDAMAIAKAKKYDVVLVDTAGRLHTKENLMEELKKIKRVMSKQLPGAPHEVMLVLDATTGQNAISQAKLFDAAVDVTGLTLTKLDGTSKGGIVANICREMKIPIRFIGIGEQMDDLRDFNADEFVDALFQSRQNSQNTSGA